MFFNLKKVILISILFLALILRTYNLANIPPSASLDEASIGYNAYSVLKTGGDEFGKFPIISQRGYDDYRRSTYLLLVIPFVAVFNLTVVAVRLPAVVLSLLTIWAVFEIALELFKKRTKFSYPVAYLSAGFLAISPWHIYISRLGHESNACLSFLVFGILFFLKGLKYPKLLLISAIFLTLSMISYYSGQVLVPLLVLGLFLLYGKLFLKVIFENKKNISISIVSAIILSLVVWSIFSPNALIRFRGTSTFSPQTHSELFAKRVELRNKAVKNHDILGSVIYNQHLFFIQVLVDGYLSHFQPQWLFTNTSQDAFKAPNVGLLYIWQFPFIIMGIFVVIFSRMIDKRTKILLFLWLFLGPLPGAIATQAPHAMRSYNMLPTWQIFTAFGVIYSIYKFKKYNLIPILGFSMLIFIGLLSFYKNYFILFPKEQSKSFQYAYAKTIPYVLNVSNKYKRIVISNKDNMYQSYMLFLYHSRYDPVLYQQQGGTKSGGYDETHIFGKYEFRPINWAKENSIGTLFVGNPDEITDGNVLFEGVYLDGKIGTKVVASN